MKIGVISDIGLMRNKNEDNYLINQEQGLFIVCDGMGGHKGGEVASQIAIDVIDKYFQGNQDENQVTMLNKAIELANRVIWTKGKEHPQLYEMGTTITAAFLDNDQLTVANVGDSSLYIIRNDNIRKVTRDHTLAQQMVSDGLLPHEEVRASTYNHVLTRALGVEEEVIIDNFTEEILPGDFVMICSDGLSDMLDENEILSIIQTDKEVDSITCELLDQALQKGGHDNITVILMRL